VHITPTSKTAVALSPKPAYHHCPVSVVAMVLRYRKAHPFYAMLRVLNGCAKSNRTVQRMKESSYEIGSKVQVRDRVKRCVVIPPLMDVVEAVKLGDADFDVRVEARAGVGREN
jgi:uncharacterized protein (DUF4213/DUF364 family)